MIVFNVLIRQTKQTIKVEVGSTILETALEAGIDYPHGCRAGNCGACKSQILSGEVELSPYSEFALSDEEYAQGLILACRAVPWSDCEVSWCELDEVAAHPVKMLHCSVESVERLTRDIASLCIRPEGDEPFTFASGQFVYIEFQGYPRREYSIASYDGDTLEFFIRRIDGGIVTPFIWDHLQQGERVAVEGPYGNMFFRDSHPGPIIAIAGGSGLSAIQPIVVEAIQSDWAYPISLYHGVRTADDLFCEQFFESLCNENENFSYIPVLSEPTAESGYRTGMLADALDNDLDQNHGFKAYLAGPPPMVRSCNEVLQRIGISPENIHADPFLNEADRAEHN